MGERHEAFEIRDIFTTRLAEVQILEGQCARLTWTVPHGIGGMEMDAVVGNLIVPVSSLDGIIEALAAARDAAG